MPNAANLKTSDPLEDPQRETSSESFLVRVWHEPSGTGGREAILRTCARRLRTGEERYFGNAGDLGRFLAGSVAAVDESE